MFNMRRLGRRYSWSIAEVAVTNVPLEYLDVVKFDVLDVSKTSEIDTTALDYPGCVHPGRFLGELQGCLNAEFLEILRRI